MTEPTAQPTPTPSPTEAEGAGVPLNQAQLLDEPTESTVWPRSLAAEAAAETAPSVDGAAPPIHN